MAIHKYFWKKKKTFLTCRLKECASSCGFFLLLLFLRSECRLCPERRGGTVGHNHCSRPLTNRPTVTQRLTLHGAPVKTFIDCGGGSGDAGGIYTWERGGKAGAVFVSYWRKREREGPAARQLLFRLALILQHEKSPSRGWALGNEPLWGGRE